MSNVGWMETMHTMIKTPSELRRFGLVMAAGLTVLGLLLLWRSRLAGPYLLAAGALFLLVGLTYPRLLSPLERAWMRLARALSVVMTRVVLTLTFYLLITPVGLLMRLFGGHTLGLRFEPERESYWIPVEPDGPGGRPDKPF